MVRIEDGPNRKYLIYSALIGLLVFGVFQFTRPIYYRTRQKTLTNNFQAQIYALQAPAENSSGKINAISETEKILKKLTKNSRRLSINTNTITYEKSYLLLESLDQYYRYRQEFIELLARIFEYNPENDLNSRSISENKGDFMYRLSLTQYALRQITARLKKYDDKQELADYTKKITSQFPPIIDLVNRLVEVTNKDQTKTSNQLRLQYIENIRQLQTTLRPLYDQTLQGLDTTTRSLLSQIKI